MQIIYYTTFILSEFLPLYYFIVKELFRLRWLPKPAQALVAQHKTFMFIHNHWHWGGLFPAHLWSTTSLQSQVSKRIMFHHMPWSATKTTSSYMHRSGQRVSYRLYPSSSQRMCIDQHIFFHSLICSHSIINENTTFGFAEWCFRYRSSSD